jgi:hypothetical protein
MRSLALASDYDGTLARRVRKYEDCHGSEFNGAAIVTDQLLRNFYCNTGSSK